MEEKLAQFLKSLRVIQPDAGFRERARRVLFASASAAEQPKSFKRGFFEDVAFGSALVFSSVAFLIIFAGASLFSANRAGLSDLRQLNEGVLLSEAESLDFNIHLGEARYFEESAQEVAALLREISTEGSEPGAPGTN